MTCVTGGETITLEHDDAPLSQFTVHLAPDKRYFTEVSNPRLFETRFASPQPFLWDMSDIDWLLERRPSEKGLPGPRAARCADFLSLGELDRHSSGQRGIGRASVRGLPADVESLASLVGRGRAVVDLHILPSSHQQDPHDQ